MEYNRLIEQAQQHVADAPDEDTIIAGVHRTLRTRCKRKIILASTACILLTVMPIAFTFNTDNISPTLAETVSATFQPSPDAPPAPLVGYRNSLRNHKLMTLI